MALLPAFTEDGLLPAGDYNLTFEELLESMLVAGPVGAIGWAADWRRKLVENLRVMTGHLVRIGVTEIFIDGSFVKSKSVPNDIDGYFVCEPERRWRGGDSPRASGDRSGMDVGIREPHDVQTVSQAAVTHVAQVPGRVVS